MAKAARKAGFSCTVSTRALIMRAPIFGSFAHEGTSPHRRARNWRPARSAPGPAGRSRTAGTGSVGATFQLGSITSSGRQSRTSKRRDRS